MMDKNSEKGAGKVSATVIYSLGVIYLLEKLSGTTVSDSVFLLIVIKLGLSTNTIQLCRFSQQVHYCWRS